MPDLYSSVDAISVTEKSASKRLSEPGPVHYPERKRIHRGHSIGDLVAPEESPLMRTNLTCAAAALMACLAFAPAILGQENCTHPQIISVTGTAEIKLAPDEVTLRLGVESHDRDLAVAKASNDRSVRKLIALARGAGVGAKNIQTSALSMEPQYSDEKIPKLLGYKVSQTITITLTDLSKYDELLTSALQAGVNRVDGINFAVADTKKYREEARLKAVRTAREKAMTMAAGLGQTVGKPWEVTEEADSDFTYLAANTQTTYQMRLPMQAAPSLAGGEVAIRASVRVSFQLE